PRRPTRPPLSPYRTPFRPPLGAAVVAAARRDRHGRGEQDALHGPAVQPPQPDPQVQRRRRRERLRLDAEQVEAQFRWLAHGSPSIMVRSSGLRDPHRPRLARWRSSSIRTARRTRPETPPRPSREQLPAFGENKPSPGTTPDEGRIGSSGEGAFHS